jgi:hypothetical protein
VLGLSAGGHPPFEVLPVLGDGDGPLEVEARRRPDHESDPRAVEWEQAREKVRAVPGAVVDAVRVGAPGPRCAHRAVPRLEAARSYPTVGIDHLARRLHGAGRRAPAGVGEDRHWVAAL